jgi:hypothetical protein
MKARNGMMNRYVALLAGGLVLMPVAAAADGPGGASLQTEGNAALAVAGGTGAAKISVVVTRPDGRPAASFGESGAALPPGWALLSGFNGGCGLVPTAFVNAGGGVYTIDVTPACGVWPTGEQHYVVSLSKNGRRGDGGNGGQRVNLRASTLGSIEVPVAPDAPVGP